MSYEDVEFLRKPAKPKPMATWPFAVGALALTASWAWFGSPRVTEGDISFDLFLQLAVMEFFPATLKTLIVGTVLYFGVLFWVDRMRGAVEIAAIFAVAIIVGVVPSMVLAAQRNAEGDLKKTAESYYLILRQDSEDYHDARLRADVESVLRADALTDDPSLTKTAGILKEARALEAEYRETQLARAGEIREGIRARMKKRGQSEAKQAKSIARFDAETKSVQVGVAKRWELEDQILDEVEATVAMLKARRSAWKTQGPNIVFYDQGVMESFRTRLSKVRALSVEQRRVAGPEIITPGASWQL